MFNHHAKYIHLESSRLRKLYKQIEDVVAEAVKDDETVNSFFDFEPSSSAHPLEMIQIIGRTRNEDGDQKFSSFLIMDEKHRVEEK